MAEVTFRRSDGNGRIVPAINVKVRVPGHAFWPDGFEDALGDDAERVVGYAYERVQERFWQEADEQGKRLGLGEVGQEGRSGGWLTLPDSGLEPEDDDADPKVVARYVELREWADAYIAAAPKRVRRMARSIAIDELSYPAWLRQYGAAEMMSARV